MKCCLGRLPRRHDPRVPHLSAILAGRPLAPPPPAIDYTRALPPNLGAMLNDSLGDCTCAAYGHAVQIWTANAAGKMVTPPDSDILALYEGSCGYKPGDSATDQGGVEQDVLTYLSTTGVAGDRLAAFVEVDPRNLDDVKRTIADCGVAYIGFNVPGFLMQGLTAPNSEWDVRAGTDDIEGGHAVVLAGYDNERVKVISWGNLYTMTWRFFSKYCDEVYAIADANWIEATGKAPCGLTLAELEEQMQALKEAA